MQATSWHALIDALLSTTLGHRGARYLPSDNYRHTDQKRRALLNGMNPDADWAHIINNAALSLELRDHCQSASCDDHSYSELCDDHSYSEFGDDHSHSILFGVGLRD